MDYSSGSDEKGRNPRRHFAVMDAEAEFSMARAMPGSRVERASLDRDAGGWRRVDALVLSAASSADTLIEADRRGLLARVAGEDRPPIIVLTDAPGADEAGRLLDLPVHDFLPLDLEAQQIEGSLALALERPVLPAGGLGQLRVADFDSRYEALRQEAERMAAALAQMAAEQAGAPPRPVDAARVRNHIKARRLRERYFEPDLFADPGWDILLDLAAARLEGRQVSVSSLCIAASVPTTTALRWIKKMSDLEMLERHPDPEDQRRAFIRMTEPTATRMKECLNATLSVSG